MKNKPFVQTITATVVEETTKTWQVNEVKKKTIKLEKQQTDKEKSDGISPDQMWRQTNVWVIVGS